jgi:hypothetical protein
MKTTATRAAAAALLLVATSACIDNNASIENFGVCYPGDAGSDSCAPDGECERWLSGQAELYLQRTMNLDGTGGTITNGLTLAMQFNNQLPNNADDRSGRTNTNDAFIEEFRFEYSSPGYPGLVLVHAEPVTAPPIPANGSATAWVPFIPPVVSEQILALMRPCPSADPTACASANVDAVVVIVNARAAGRYGSDQEFETSPYPLPVLVHSTVFPGYVCPVAGDVLTAVCPNAGQTSTFKCETPEDTTTTTP